VELRRGGAGFFRMQIESEAIRTIRYDAERRKLFVGFTGGDEYVYVGVPGEVHRSFVEASSRGGFFVHEIRDHYPYNRLDH
jgi:lysyl-tRNA synthetase class 2